MSSNLNKYIEELDRMIAEIEKEKPKPKPDNKFIKPNPFDSISKTFKANEIIEKETYINFVENKKIDTNKNIESIYNDYLSELNKLIGLEEVKTEIKKLINYLVFYKKIGNKVKYEKPNLNMIFRGNPGTGKTTVAKIVANILSDLGFLNRNIMIETTPRDFIAGYVGQTAIKAKKTIDSAKGGVIFIDEAYAFTKTGDENENTFAYEAITEIIKEMEKKETIFIFSGYSKEMNNFIKLNPGIKSRIGYDIEFKNYEKEELFKMFENKVENSGLKLSESAKKILLEKIEEKRQEKNFGNGRMIDNLFDEVIKEHATINIKEDDYQKLLIIKEDSINNIRIKKEGGIIFE